MRLYDAPNVRNVAVVGHGGCGKTTLVSALLFDMGASTRLGRVEDGTTVTDFDADEIERKISLQAAIAWGEWKKTRINLIDAPGYANFVAEARAALRAADAAIVVVDAVAGVEVQTEKAWSICDEYGLPRLVVINRMDRDRASFERTLESLRSAFGRGVIPIAMPLAEEKDFTGVAELETDKADVYAADQSGQFQQTDVPAALKESEAALHAQLVEMVAEADETLMEEFFAEGNLPLAGPHQGATLERALPPPLPGAPCVFGAERGDAPDPRCNRGPPPLPRGSAGLEGHGPGVGVRGRALAGPRRPSVGLRLQDDGGSPRGTRVAGPRRLGLAQGRRERLQREPGRWWSASAHSSPSRARPRPPCRSSGPGTSGLSPSSRTP